MLFRCGLWLGHCSTMLFFSAILLKVCCCAWDHWPFAWPSLIYRGVDGWLIDCKTNPKHYPSSAMLYRCFEVFVLICTKCVVVFYGQTSLPGSHRSKWHSSRSLVVCSDLYLQSWALLPCSFFLEPVDLSWLLRQSLAASGGVRLDCPCLSETVVSSISSPRKEAGRRERKGRRCCQMVPRHLLQDMCAFWMNGENICGPDTLIYLSQKSPRDSEQSGHD